MANKCIVCKKPSKKGEMYCRVCRPDPYRINPKEIRIDNSGQIDDLHTDAVFKKIYNGSTKGLKEDFKGNF